MSTRSSLLRSFFAALLLSVTLSVSVGCDGASCYTPTPADEVEESFLDKADDALDAIDATEAQREAVEAKTRALVAKMMGLRKARWARHEALLDEVKKAEPSAERVKRLAAQMSAPAAALYLDVVDESLSLWPLFDATQRKALAAHLDAPFEPMEESWVFDGIVAYQLSKLDATEAQRAMIEKLKKDYLFKINLMLRKGWSDTQRIWAELERAKPNEKKIKDIVRAQAARYDRLVVQLIEDGEVLMATLSRPSAKRSA